MLPYYIVIPRNDKAHETRLGSGKEKSSRHFRVSSEARQKSITRIAGSPGARCEERECDEARHGHAISHYRGGKKGGSGRGRGGGKRGISIARWNNWLQSGRLPYERRLLSRAPSFSLFSLDVGPMLILTLVPSPSDAREIAGKKMQRGGKKEEQNDAGQRRPSSFLARYALALAAGVERLSPFCASFPPFCFVLFSPFFIRLKQKQPAKQLTSPKGES